MAKQIIKPTDKSAAERETKVRGKGKVGADGRTKVSQEVYDTLPPSVKARCIACIVMVKIQFGAIVTDMRGKVGGHVFARNSSGSYMRPKTIPVNTDTLAQRAVRGLFNNVAVQWRLLSDMQREAFITYAPDYTNLNVWGSSQPLTGQQLFMKQNQQLSAVGLAQVTNCIPPQSVSIANATAVGVVITGAVMTVELMSATGADNVIAIYATAPLSAGVTFVGKSKYKLITTKPISMAAGDYDIDAAYEAVFGSPFNPLNEGSKIAFRLVRINVNNGQTSTPKDFMSTIAA